MSDLARTRSAAEEKAVAAHVAVPVAKEASVYLTSAKMTAPASIAASTATKATPMNSAVHSARPVLHQHQLILE